MTAKTTDSYCGKEELQNALRSRDWDAQMAALNHLCPCRNRFYDRELWLAIFHAHTSTSSAKVKDAARHAIETLRQRVRTDPRSQELVHWLATQHRLAEPLVDAIPVWQEPAARGGDLVIPAWERGGRSRANRTRRR